MCRVAAYVGAPRALADLLSTPPHGLEHQAHAPREQQHGTMNVDGTGVVWWPDDDDGPLRYATTSPPWSDENLRALAPRLRGRAIVGAVRGATPGIAHGRGAVAPFLLDDLAVAHNGWIDGFPGPVAERLLADLPPARIAQAEMLTDSTLIALTLAETRTATDDLLDAVRTAIWRVATAARAATRTATLNLVASDGRVLVGARTSVGAPGNSLYVLSATTAPGMHEGLLASEPLDDRAWVAVPDDTLVEVRPDGHRLVALDPTDIGATA